jgi:hypothetical protein
MKVVTSNKASIPEIIARYFSHIKRNPSLGKNQKGNSGRKSKDSVLR